MAIIPGDPTFIEHKERYFMNVAKEVAKGSNHPMVPGGCIIVRDREILGDGRSILAGCKVEIDCVTYAIATASKRGTPLGGSVVYTTRYPFSAAVFQLHLMGIKRVMVLAHQWEPYYKDEFRRASRLGRELSIAIEPIFEDEDQRFSTKKSNDYDFEEPRLKNKELYTGNPIEEDSFDIEKFTDSDDESDFTVRH